MMIEARLRCELVPGVFSNEWGVQFSGGEDGVCASFVDRRDVTTLTEPADDSPGEGLLAVHKVREEGGMVLVLLPRETTLG